MDERRELLRHAVATVAYRGAKALGDAPPGFGVFDAGASVRTPLALVAHVGDLFDWSLSLAEGRGEWREASPLAWDQEVERFFATIAAFDAFLASDTPLACGVERLLQGPVADALTHVGQIMLLRRLAGAKVKSENYFKADVAPGRVGSTQVPPKREFD